MKLSRKIIIAFLVIIQLMTAASFVYIRVVGEAEPSEILESMITINYYPGEFNSISVQRGEFNVIVNRGDFFSVSVQGGDNLLNNYLNIDVVDDVLLIDLDSQMKTENLSVIVTVTMPNLKKLEHNNSSYIVLDGLNEKEMMIELNAGGISIDNCSIEKLTVRASGDSYFGAPDSDIGIFNYSVSDSAYMFVRGEMYSDIKQVNDRGVLVNIPDDENIAVKISEQRKELIELMSSYWSGLKWSMPIDTVIRIMELDSMNLRIDERKLKFLPRSFTEREILTYYTVSDFYSDISYVSLVFYKGLLTDITVTYNILSDLDAISSKHAVLFNEKYGERYEFDVPFHLKVDWIDNYRYYWKADEENLKNQFTSVRILKDDNRFLSIGYSDPYNSVFRKNIENLNKRPRSNFKSFPTVIDYFISMFSASGN